MLPDGQIFTPPERKKQENLSLTSDKASSAPKREGDGDADSEDGSEDYWWDTRKITRRMSGTLESILADTATAKNPAFITRYRAPREPAPSDSVLH